MRVSHDYVYIFPPSWASLPFPTFYPSRSLQSTRLGYLWYTAASLSIKREQSGTSLAMRWLGLHVSTERGTILILGWPNKTKPKREQSKLMQFKSKRAKELEGLCIRAQPRLTLRNPMDCSPPGSSVHGILQARLLEWDAISFSISLVNTPQSFILSSLSLLSW